VIETGTWSTLLADEQKQETLYSSHTRSAFLKTEEVDQWLYFEDCE